MANHWSTTLEIKLPKILEIPEKLQQLLTKIDDYRYFLLEGGRGGGKSQTIARILLYLCERYKLRVVCGREIQNSISESVYTLFDDLIKEHQLDFEVMSTKITHRRTGSTINFRGFREQSRFNIQGLEGVDFLWIDESQALRRETINVLIPTIRKENAKIVFSMNRHVVDDPAYDLFHNRDDCLHISINFNENKYCPQALIRESEECKARSQADYDHIWMGIPLDKSEDVVFGHNELHDLQHYPLRDSYGLRLGGFDIARFGDDKCACVAIQQMGALHWEVFHAEQWDKRDLNYTTGRILATHKELGLLRSKIDEDGMGAGPLDSLREGRGDKSFEGFRNLPMGYSDDKFYGNHRTKNVYKLKDLVLKGHICIKDTDLIKELLTLRYKYDNYQRRILVSKDQMRKDGVKSPNLADALIMAVSMIGEIKYDQEHMYYNKPKYAIEEDLFKLSGIE